MLPVGNVSAFGRQALGRDKPCPYGCETHGFILGLHMRRIPMLPVGNVSAFGRQALGRDKPCPYGCETHGFIPVGATLVVARGWV